MKLKRILMSTLVALGLCASAQAQQPQTVEVFDPHWFVQVQPLGAQYTLGEAEFSDLISYNVQAGVGYQFNPVLALRLTANAWQSRAGLDVGDYYMQMKGLTSRTWKWNYVAPMVDANVNLTNLLLGYKYDRLFNFGIFAGLGANIAFSNDEANDIFKKLNPGQVPGAAQVGNYQSMEYTWDGTQVYLTGRVGVTGDFRINDMFSVGLEVNANALSDKYNSKKAGNLDWYFNALAGVRINLGQTHHTEAAKGNAAPQIIHRVDTIYVKQQVPVQAQRTPAPATAAAQSGIAPLRRDIFFTIRATQVASQENKDKVKEVADYLKKYPNAKVSVTGYADKGTGNATINTNLSQKRAKTVADILKNQYGIDASRITVDYKGHTEQPFSENDKNRVTICIAQ